MCLFQECFFLLSKGPSKRVKLFRILESPAFDFPIATNCLRLNRDRIDQLARLHHCFLKLKNNLSNNYDRFEIDPELTKTFTIRLG